MPRTVLAVVISFLFTLAAGAAPCMAASASATTPRPRLILAIAIDQFRADYLTRFESRFLPAHGKAGDVGGFRYLMTQGAYYPYGQYDLLECVTGAGHATYLTGSYPYRSGIPLNDWFDQARGVQAYCTEDAKSLAVTQQGVEAGPGDSPRNLIGTTVGDELKNSGMPSHVVSVALKDRAAILMGGQRADLAIWMGAETQWRTSQYYQKDGKLPDWVRALNAEIAKRLGQKVEWKAEGTPSGMSSAAVFGDNPKMGNTFPHLSTYGSRESRAGPVGASLTVEMAETAATAYNLGRGAGTDLLAVSFSEHDYMGHAFGPNSPELEDLTVHEDQAIAGLLNFIRRRVPGGLDGVVVTLTGDHGVAPRTEQAQLWGMDADRIDQIAIGKKIAAVLTERHGAPKHGEWLPLVDDFNFWINHAVVAERGLELVKVQAEVKAELEKVPGALWVFTEEDYRAGRLPPGLYKEQIDHHYFPGRSGDVIMIPRPFYTQVDGYPVNHVTGYSYDRSVPIVIAGPGVKPGLHAERAEVVDIAPTLSFLSGVLPPAMSEGRVLTESLDAKHIYPAPLAK